MKKIVIATIPIIVSLFYVSSAFAEIRVISVRGSVAYKIGKQWRSPLTRGMILKEGTKISTGVRSRAVIRLNNHTLTIRPLTMIKINESSIKNKRSRTRIGLRRGKIRAKISRSKRIRTIFKVSTPVATSSVRGSEEIISYGPSNGMRNLMINGSAMGENPNGSRRFLKGRLEYRQRQGKPKPDNLLAKVRKKSFTRTHPRFITGDEETGIDYHGDDSLYYGQISGEGTISNFTTPVNIQLVWPD